MKIYTKGERKADIQLKRKTDIKKRQILFACKTYTKCERKADSQLKRKRVSWPEVRRDSYFSNKFST